MMVRGLLCLLLVSVTSAIAVSQDDLQTAPKDSVRSLTAAEFASNATAWKMQRDCLEACSEHGMCENGLCKCVQPFCGKLCNRQCQNGATCNVGPNRCLCTAGWMGEFCEIPEPGASNLGAAKDARAKKTHDKYLMARVIEGGRLPSKKPADAACSASLGTLELEFPSDISLTDIVSVQAMCINHMQNKVFFGVSDTVSSPVSFGSSLTCKEGTKDLNHGTLVNPRTASTDFRFRVQEGTIVVDKLGASPELERCNIRVTISYFG